MNKLFKIYDSTIELITSTLMAFLVIILFGQVVSRYIFNFPMMWSEEIGRYLFIWIAYLGSAQVFIKGEHLSVDVLSSKLISPYNSYLKLITHIIIIIFLFFVFLYGLKYTEMHWDNPAYS
ncbi:MAG: TRAP transporter small permease, partial [Actinobacteria bacterium]|nr:TRAP transporter small permease [Actinomycetota bacterium]